MTGSVNVTKAAFAHMVNTPPPNTDSVDDLDNEGFQQILLTLCKLKEGSQTETHHRKM